MIHVWKLAGMKMKSVKNKCGSSLLIKQGLDFELVVELVQLHQKPEQRGNESETGSPRNVARLRTSLSLGRNGKTRRFHRGEVLTGVSQ